MATYTIIPFNTTYYYYPELIPTGQVMEGSTINVQEGDVFILGDLGYNASNTTFVAATGETAPVAFEVQIDHDISYSEYTDVFRFTYGDGTEPTINIADGVDASCLAHNGTASDGIHVTAGVDSEIGAMLGGTGDNGVVNTYDIGNGSSFSYIDGRAGGEDVINLSDNVTAGFVWTGARAMQP